MRCSAFVLSLCLLLVACNDKGSTGPGADDSSPDGNTTTDQAGVITPDGSLPAAITTLTAGQTADGVTLRAAGYTLDVIIPPAQTTSAPFDSAVLPDGRIVMAGSDGSLKSVALDGTVTDTGYPSGMNFESDSGGTMWYYDWVGGQLRYWDGTTGSPFVAATLASVYTGGSIAVSPDGGTVYVGWWKIDYDLGTKSSILYRYTTAGGLEEIFQGSSTSVINAVEVTADGVVYIAMSDGIYKLDGNDRKTLVHSLTDKDVRSDALTSDEYGNLYFAAFGNGMGVHKLAPDGTLTQLVAFDDTELLPFGLNWDSARQLITGVRKERGELVTISLSGEVKVVNNPSGLTTPIAIEEHPSGSIMVNGDEAGLLLIEGDGSVTVYKDGITSFQPPAADFAFTADGTAYYTYAAPGFDNMIVTIGTDGAVTEVTREPGAPAGIEIADERTIYYADYGNGAVMQLHADGTSTVIMDGIQNPVGIALDAAGYLWVGAAHPGATGDPNALDEVYNKRILRFRPGDDTAEEVIAFDDSEWHALTFFDVDDSGNLYLPDGERLLRRESDGALVTIADGFGAVRGAAVASDGAIYFVDYEAAALYRLNPG